ncbi:hypothetical protein OQ496_03345 [Acetobacter suratthaniensis]|uniref:Uncharacterized protein n=1 Tax=Acetobacter suratthaniensis TaxID=1502841 RepID=A0ABS3LH39_9PROT|nr:hypothetical protein [Acetobacter suratthaniensis]MBO1326902.1 hypothetical protein [Acetobacter suratthaniensis]MCX2565491.1 hypothetical protein [Acetobacter suratthaniensis]
MTGLSPLTAFEQESVKALRVPDVVLNDARKLSGLVVAVAESGVGAGREITEPEALLWLAHRLQDKLDLLAALSGDGNAPGWMQPEEVQP